MCVEKAETFSKNTKGKMLPEMKTHKGQPFWLVIYEDRGNSDSPGYILDWLHSDKRLRDAMVDDLAENLQFSNEEFDIIPGEVKKVISRHLYENTPGWVFGLRLGGLGLYLRKNCTAMVNINNVYYGDIDRIENVKSTIKTQFLSGYESQQVTFSLLIPKTT